MLKSIEQHRKSFLSGSESIPSPFTFSNYIKYRLKIEHSEGNPLSDKSINAAIEEANKAYR